MTTQIAFSANLGFLWKELSLPDAIRAAHDAGFDAVECHGPYDTPAEDVKRTLHETELTMLSLNTRTGEPGELGVAALPGRIEQAAGHIDEAIAYAEAIGCHAVSVLAGISGRTNEAEEVYRHNLAYAAVRADEVGIDVFIEPLNTNVSPGYHLVSADAAVKTIEAVGVPNVKIMFDTFHVSVMDGDLEPVFARVAKHVGHVQFASIPHRNEPDAGDVDYRSVLTRFAELGYRSPFGAEYNPRTTVENGLGWMAAIRGEST